MRTRPGARAADPSNCDDLLFDDVLWVERARRDHADFVATMRGLGIEVLEMHELLAQTLAVPGARAWLLDEQVVPNQVGVGLSSRCARTCRACPTVSWPRP